MREQPTLLLLHGGPGVADHSMFKPLLSALADLAQIVYLDHRGNGRSERDVPERWNLQQWPRMYVHSGMPYRFRPPSSWGRRLGGMIAIVYAARFPDQPGGRILDSTTPRNSLHRARQQQMLAVFERIGGVRVREAAQRFFQERLLEAGTGVPASLSSALHAPAAGI